MKQGSWRGSLRADGDPLNAERWADVVDRWQYRLRTAPAAVIDEDCVEDQAGLALGPAEGSSLDPKTATLLRVGAAAAIGASPACLEWSTGRALAAGSSSDEIADVLLAIAPVIGLGRIVSAVPEMAAALGFDIQAALEETRWPVTRMPADYYVG